MQYPLTMRNALEAAIDGGISLIQLVSLWLLTLVWLGLGGCLVFGVALTVTSRWGAAVALLLVWVSLLRWGLRTIPVGGLQQWGWQLSVYVGFLVSQLAVLC